MNCLKSSGRSTSITLMSLEKRLKIRPNGIVSKNNIGFFNKLFNAKLCSFSAALNTPIKRAATNNKTITAARFQRFIINDKKFTKSPIPFVF